MARKYMARGWSGVKRGSQLEKDLAQLSDREKKQKLAETTKDNFRRVEKGEKPRSVRQYEADNLMRQIETAQQKIRRYQAKAAELREKAAEVERSGTGNTGAADTYRKAAEEYLARVRDLQAQLDVEE